MIPSGNDESNVRRISCDLVNSCQSARTTQNRRRFLQSGAMAITTATLADIFGPAALAQVAGERVQLTTFPKKRTAAVSELGIAKPIMFDYPGDELHHACALIRLNRRAGGGVGEKQDIVAFSTTCTHMGGDMSSGYISEHQVLGCGEHLTTFDLTRHGIVVAGHATSSLPQVVLQIEDDFVFAIGVIGLFYGYASNRIPATE